MGKRGLSAIAAPHGSLSLWDHGSTFQPFQTLFHPKPSLGVWDIRGSPAQMTFESGIFLLRTSGNGCGQLSGSRGHQLKMCREFPFLLETLGCGPRGGEIHPGTLQILHHCASDPAKNHI